nr:MAG TPA: hypothetical protein [Caudoviricetes sp.]
MLGRAARAAAIWATQVRAASNNSRRRRTPP